MNDPVTPGQALNQLAAEFSKLADALEAENGREKTARGPSALDYGALGSASLTDADALTAFLLR